MERAPRVCATCKARKKGCDKALPICGYCAQRGLICLYEEPNVAESRAVAGDIPLWTNDQLLPLSSSGSTVHGPPITTHQALHGQLCDLFQITQCGFPELRHRYFQSFHRWLPILSEDLLANMVLMFPDTHPSADMSLLIMAMFLVTMDPSDDSSAHSITPCTLYLELRMSLARVQAKMTASSHLIQTGILLTAYEYACGKPRDAYISIGTCVRMASILGIDKPDLSTRGDCNDLTLRLASLERQNIYWGMIMLERLVLYECPHQHLKPALEFPPPQTELPSDLQKVEAIDKKPPSVNGRQGTTVLDIHSKNVGSFGRQIQAISFLIKVMESTNENNDISLPELIELDGKLREFLSILMSQSSQRHTCGANGITIRSLVRLHQYILNRFSSSDPQDVKAQKQSHVALDTLSRMMIEVAHDHLERFVPGNIDSLPLSCSYNMRSMMELVEDRWGAINAEQPPKELETFVALHEAVCKRWRFSVEH